MLPSRMFALRYCGCSPVSTVSLSDGVNLGKGQTGYGSIVTDRYVSTFLDYGDNFVFIVNVKCRLPKQLSLFTV